MVWSLFGLVLPAVVGLAATPAIIRGFGDERFGVLTLAWMVVGYFSLFDLGLGRAITRRVAELLTEASWDELHRVVWTAWGMVLALGLIGGAIGALLVPFIVRYAVNVSPGLAAETAQTFWLLTLSVPIVVFTTGTRGVLEAAQRFGLVNAVRIPTGILTFLVPLITLQQTNALPPAIVGLIMVRLAGGLAYTVMAVSVLDRMPRRPVFSSAAARDLLRFGAWMTVSNVVSPMMVTFDRFAISALISVAAVTYYATPYEAASKIMFIPAAVGSVLFPALAAAYSSDRARVATLFQGATRALLLLAFPPVFLLVCFAPEVLGLWLGEPFPERSTAVLQWLLFGMLINAPGQLAFALVQSSGRSDITARLHLLEVVPYVGALILLMRWRGIEGAAIAWTLRVLADTVFLTGYAARLSNLRVRDLLPALPVPLALLAFCIAAALPLPLASRVGLALLFSAVYLAGSWGWGGIGEIVRGRMPALFQRT